MPPLPSTAMMSSVTTSNRTASLFGNYARLLDSCVRGGVTISEALERDCLKELANDLWTIHDNFAEIVS
jgi:hypothetical protein